MFIAVDGCVGVGKSTVVKGLAEHRKSEALFESFESNPFLPSFYDDPKGFATETEFTFLCLHFHQLKTRASTISKGEVIADFHLGKDLLYAGLNLVDAKTLGIFKQLYGLFAEQIPQPTLLVCLSASSKLLIRRIMDRKRDFELKVDPQYYVSLNFAYEKFFHGYTGPKLKIAMDDWDFVKTPALFPRLSQLIDEQIAAK